MIKIGFTGDFCPWLRIEEQYKTGNWKQLFESVHPFFSQNNLNVMDLECPLTTSSEKLLKTGPHLKANPKTVEILEHLNCKLVATANNHFKDYGWKGMQETYKTLTENNIAWMGSGQNYAEASQTFFWVKDDITIAFINIAENEWSTTVNKDPGCHAMDVVNVFHKIKEAKDNADFIVVIPHGGHEHYALPSPRMKKWYRFFVDAGANAVIGHHTHIVSGHEVYKEAPIFYSLGNFCFDWEKLREQPWNQGMLVRLEFKKNQPVSFELEFVHQNNDALGVFLVAGKEKQHMLVNLEKINAIIADDDKLTEAFQNYIASWKPLMNTWVQPYKGTILPSLHKKGLLPSLIGKHKKLLLTNLIRCEAHRDILINTINPNN
jgi:poly-gamma-glutamate synthesis protein (capsule biosynthesis protein)